MLLGFVLIVDLQSNQNTDDDQEDFTNSVFKIPAGKAGLPVYQPVRQPGFP